MRSPLRDELEQLGDRVHLGAAKSCADAVELAAIPAAAAAQLDVRRRSRPAVLRPQDLVELTSSAVPQSTQRPPSLHQTANRMSGDISDASASRGSSPSTVAHASASASARCRRLRSASRTKTLTSRGSSPSSSHQNRSRCHHQLRPSYRATRTGRSACELASGPNPRSEHSWWSVTSAAGRPSCARRNLALCRSRRAHAGAGVSPRPRPA
jgi:hypothetical protein